MGCSRMQVKVPQHKILGSILTLTQEKWIICNEDIVHYWKTTKREIIKTSKINNNNNKMTKTKRVEIEMEDYRAF
jgi:hypothetical protein